MILVTGATGTVGGAVLRLLAARDIPVRAMTRDPARLAPSATVEVVRADFTDPASLHKALDGVAAVYLSTAPGAWIPAHDTALLRAAQRRTVRKVVKLSAVRGTPKDGGPTPSNWHTPGEAALAAGPWDWSVLRPTSFASNALRWADPIRAGQPVPNTTGTGPQGVVDPRDVAEVAVEALLTPRLDGVTSTLTGPELLTVPNQADRLGRVLGRPVTTVDVDPEQAARQMLASGVDPSVVDVAVRGARLVAEHGNTVLTDEVERLLHRPPRSFLQWCRDHRDAFAPDDRRDHEAPGP